MEKKYLIGYMFGKPYLRFDDIQNFNEEADENGDVHITFTDKDGDYHYVQCAGGFREVDNKAPRIERYEVRGRRTIKRNGLDTAMAEVKPDEYQERRNRFHAEPEQDEDEPEETYGSDPYGNGMYDPVLGQTVYLAPDESPEDEDDDLEDDDLDYNYIDNNNTGYQGEDFLDEMLIDEPVEQVMEERGISSPEELLDHYVISLEEGGIGVSEEYQDMLLNKIKSELNKED